MFVMVTRKKTKIVMSGNSQAVRIPREFKLEGDEVEIQGRGNTLLIRQKKQMWQLLTDSLALFTDGFMEEGRSSRHSRSEGAPSHEGDAGDQHLHLPHQAATPLLSLSVSCPIPSETLGFPVSRLRNCLMGSARAVMWARIATRLSCFSPRSKSLCLTRPQPGLMVTCVLNLRQRGRKSGQWTCLSPPTR